LQVKVITQIATHKTAITIKQEVSPQQQQQQQQQTFERANQFEDQRYQPYQYSSSNNSSSSSSSNSSSCCSNICRNFMLQTICINNGNEMQAGPSAGSLLRP